MGQLGISADWNQTQLILAGLYRVWSLGWDNWINWALTLHQVSLSLFAWQTGRVPREKAKLFKASGSLRQEWTHHYLHCILLTRSHKASPSSRVGAHPLLMAETAKSNCKWCRNVEWCRSAVIFQSTTEVILDTSIMIMCSYCWWWWWWWRWQ